MAQQPRLAPQNDVYTLMLIVAGVLLLTGIIFMAVRSQQFFGSVFPPSG
jgi:hypothetical protein